MDPAQAERDVGDLVEAWCDRRAFRALRQILAGYPLTSRLTDDWAGLLTALEAVRGLAADELIDDEPERVDRLISAVSAIVYH
jgi:hypothetical protein